MQCQSCESNNPETSKFCSSCGNPLLISEDIKSPSEVTFSWLVNVMKSLGYKMQNENEADKILLARHVIKPRLLISLKEEMITFCSAWKIKKPGWTQKEYYLNAVNKANKHNWLCACSLNSKMDQLDVSGMLFLTDKISSQDIASYVDLFSACIYNILEMPEISSLG